VGLDKGKTAGQLVKLKINWHFLA